MTEKGLVDQKEMDKVLAEMKKEGFDIDGEVADQQEGIRPVLPQIKLEHSGTGKHRMYLDLQTGDEGIIDVTDNILNAVVVINQHIRAWWDKDTEEKMPDCSSVEGIPNVKEPVNPTCQGCPKNGFPGDCKPKVRLLIITKHPVTDEAGPAVFNIPTTSIKNWDTYIRSLGRMPVMGVQTQFSLVDVKKDPYRWATVAMRAAAGSDSTMRKEIKELREKMGEVFQQVHAEDFEDPGDKSKKIDDLPF